MIDILSKKGEVKVREKDLGKSRKQATYIDGLYAGRNSQVQNKQQKNDSANQPDSLSKEKIAKEGEVDRVLNNNDRQKEFFEEIKPSFFTVCGKKIQKSFSFFINKLSFSNLLSLLVLTFFVSGAFSLYSQAESIQGEVKGATYLGKDYLTKAHQSADKFDVIEASRQFDLAAQEIGLASQALIKKGQYNPYWNQLASVKDPTSSMISSIILIDQTITQLDQVFKLFLEIVETGDFNQDKQKIIYKKLSKLETNLALLNKDISSLASNEEFFPSQIDSLKKDISLIEGQVVLIKDFVKNSPDFLGLNKEKKYLLLFQNNSEPRPTGGFIGTFGYLTLNKGEIKNLFIDEIYGPRDKLRDTKLDQIKETDLGYPENMPEELIPVKEIFEEYRYSFYVQGTNCTTDFPTSAKRALWSFENVLEQPHAQDVISITPNVIEDILDILGPIKFEDYNLVLNAKNFRDIIQYKVEVDNPFKLEGEEDYNPKQIIVDFTPILFERIANSSLEEKFKIFARILDNAQDQHILLYSQNEKNSSFIQKYKLGGQISQDANDYLQINLDARNATKSGLYLEKDYSLETVISEDNEVSHKLVMKLKNNAQGDLYYYSRLKLLTRVMVPYGSQLKSFLVEGVDRKEEVKFINESGKLNFLFLVELEEQEEKEIEIEYDSSYLIGSDSSYKLNYQLQPGSILTNFDWQVALPVNRQVVNYLPKELKFASQKLINFEREDIKRNIDFEIKLTP